MTEKSLTILFCSYIETISFIKLILKQQMRVKLIPLLRFGSQLHKALTSQTQNVFFSSGLGKRNVINQSPKHVMMGNFKINRGLTFEHLYHITI